MAIPFLKVQAEEAVQILDQCIVTGYQLKDKICSDYDEMRDKLTAEDISEWKRSLSVWTKECLDMLSTVFVSLKEQYNFRDAPVSPFVQANTHIEWNGVMNQLKGRIDKLNEYDRFIREKFNINIEVVGRDKIVQNGDSGRIDIRN